MNGDKSGSGSKSTSKANTPKVTRLRRDSTPPEYLKNQDQGSSGLEEEEMGKRKKSKDRKSRARREATSPEYLFGSPVGGGPEKEDEAICSPMDPPK